MSEASIIAKARMIPRDYGETFTAKVVGDGVTQRFDLPSDNIDPVSFTARIEPSTALSPGTLGALLTNQYYLDARTGTVTLWAPLTLNAVVTAAGTAYLDLLPADMESWVQTAFDMHTQGVLPAPTMDDLSPTEEYLVAMLASVEFLWSAAVEASGEIDVLTPEGVQIPRSQRFAQIMSLIQQIQAHYKELAAAFNVGPYRIQMLNLRRVSRTTGRLVPVYVEQEFDDRTYPPTRVYPPIDTGLL